MPGRDWWYYLITATIILVIGIAVCPITQASINSSEIKATDKDIDHAIETGNALMSNGSYAEAGKEFGGILAKISPNDFPDKFCTLQNNLGMSYYILALENDTEDNLEKAIHAFKEGLTIATIDKYPEEYAILNNNLGNAYDDLASYRDSSSNLMHAISAYNESLKIYTKDRYPEKYEMEQNQKRDALKSLSEIDKV